MSLLSRLQQLGQASAAPEGQTEELRQRQRALTGKGEVEQAGPKAASISERIAQQQVSQIEEQTEKQETQLVDEIETRAQQVAQTFDAAKLQQMEQLLNAKQQIQQQTTQLLNQATREGKKLDARKQAAAVEQLGFELRMNNDEYIQKLQHNGIRARLDNQVAFKEELQRSIFANEMELFNSSLDFQRLLQSEGRDLMQQLHQLDLDHFRILGRMQVDSANKTNMYSGISSMISGGAQAYQKYNEK